MQDFFILIYKHKINYLIFYLPINWQNTLTILIKKAYLKRFTFI